MLDSAAKCLLNFGLIPTSCMMRYLYQSALDEARVQPWRLVMTAMVVPLNFLAVCAAVGFVGAILLGIF